MHVAVAEQCEMCIHAFRRKGYQGVSVRDLEDATGLKMGSIYNSFGDKAGLFDAAFAHYNRVVLQRRIELVEQLFAESWNPVLQRFRSPYAFRGLSSAGHKLSNSLLRLTAGQSINTLELSLLRNFRKYAHAQPAPGIDSIWHWLALGQHHGLPTRLIDWTYSPFVALHFATEYPEEYDNGKSYLPGPCVLLFLFGLWRRQPLPRILPLRRGVALADQRMERVRVLEWMALPPRSRAQFHEHDMSHMAGTAPPGSTQSWPNQEWADRGCPRRPPRA